MYEIEREYVIQVKDQIDSFECEIPEVRRVIDWGSKQRGQGKRSGSTIKGSMSAAPVGKKTYTGVSLAEYLNDDTKDSLRYMDNSEACRYIKARKFGCSHIEAKIYSLM